MTRIAPRFLGFLLLSGLATSPALAQMYNAGDACPEPTPGRVFTQEGAAGPALVCNGTTLEVYESVLTGPLRKGIGTATPQATLDISSTDSVLLPRGTTAERPGTPVNGMIRYNSTNNKFEAYENGAWTNVIGGGSVSWPLQAPDGSATAPSYGFANYSTAGMYADSNADLFIAAHGNEMTFIADAGNTSSTDQFYWRSTDGSQQMSLIGRTLNMGNSEDAGQDIDGLDIRGWSNVGIIITNEASGDGNPFLRFELDEDVPLFEIGIDDADGDKFKISGGNIGTNDRLSIDSTGKVGVGTASPAATLHVNGEAIIGNTSLACSGTTEGAQRYNSTDHVMEFCNGTTWTPFAQVQTTSGPTAPAGSGYFVLTHTTWNGNLGGIAGADAKCLTELGTTYTSWRGYTTANSNGQITAGKVHAFLCDQNGSCNNLMPLTTYYFAYANSGTPGGASFTTDATGLGPNDSAMWSAANYFSGTYTYWMNRQDDPGGGITPTKWVNDKGDSSDCSLWTSSSSGGYGNYGDSGTNDALRWWGGSAGCNITRRLICFVNP